MIRKILAGIACSIGFSLALPSHATLLYATSYEGSRLVSVDTATNTVTTLVNTPSGADSLVFDASGRIIYSQLNTGQVRRFDPFSNTDVLIASGLSGPADLALAPDGLSVLVSETNIGHVTRINLTTGATTAVYTLGRTDGIIYDNLGHLFVNTGGWSGSGRILQLDATTGAVIHQSAMLTGLDGLTFDTGTGTLFAASLSGNGFYQVSTDLQTVTSHLGTVGSADGIAADGMGNIFIASRADAHIYEYNIGSNTVTQLTGFVGLDDLAPVSGFGAHTPAAPEPASLALLSLGLAGLGFSRRKKA